MRSRLLPPPGTPKRQPTPASRSRRTMMVRDRRHEGPHVLRYDLGFSHQGGAVSGAELQQDLRAAVRDLCKAFPDSYWRELDARRAYPEAFVRALTEAGYLAALIPEEYGGSGLGVAEASIILEEINRSGAQRRRVPRADVHDGHAAPARLRGAEARVPAEDRERRAAAPGVRRQRADDRLGHDAAQDARRPQGRPLRRPRPEGLDLPRRAFRPPPARRPHDADRAGEEADRRAVDAARRHARGGRPRPDDPPDPHDDEPRDDRAVLRRPRGAGRTRSSARKARGSATCSTA